MKLFIAALPFLAFALTAADTPVVVNNTEKDPVPVRVQGPSQPFSFSNQIINPGGSGLVEYPQFNVPAGKRLIIETISVRTRSVGLFDLKLRFNAPQVQAFTIPLNTHPIQSPLSTEGVILTGMHNVRIYVPGGQSVRLQMVGGPSQNVNNQTFVDFALSGHLVDEF